jgi:peptidoglycan-associated lipoprotein
MRKRIFGCIVVLCLATFVSGGCAKKDVVKTEEQPTATAVQAVPHAPAVPESVRPADAEKSPASANAPLAETATQEAAVKQEPAKEMITGGQGAGALENELQKIYFNFDSADLSAESRTALSKNAELLAKQPSVSIRIEGNCDERGSDEYNLALGERRAKAAKDYLVNLGVQPERLSVISYGEEKPADPGHDEAAWAKNRRDEFVITK